MVARAWPVQTSTRLPRLALALSCLFYTHTHRVTASESLCGCSITRQAFCLMSAHKAYIDCANTAVSTAACPGASCQTVISNYYATTMKCFDEYDCSGANYQPTLPRGNSELETNRWLQYGCSAPTCTDEEGGGGGGSKISAFGVLCIVAVVFAVIAFAARKFRPSDGPTTPQGGRQTVRLGKSSLDTPAATSVSVAQPKSLSPAELWCVTHGVSLSQQARPHPSGMGRSSNGVGRSSINSSTMRQTSASSVSPMTTVPVEAAIIRGQQQQRSVSMAAYSPKQHGYKP